MRRCRSLPLKMRRTTTKNTGTKNTASTTAVIMPPITPVPMARWLAEPAPLARNSGSTPRMKASEVITMGRKRRCAAVQRRFDRALALGLQVLRELDDQDRVLRRQADDGDQADLEVHVVRIAAEQRRQHHAQHAQRHHQDHRERDGPAFVQRRQAQEHRQDREAVEDQRLVPASLFLARLMPVHSKPKPAGSCAARRSISAIASPVL